MTECAHKWDYFHLKWSKEWNRACRACLVRQVCIPSKDPNYWFDLEQLHAARVIARRAKRREAYHRKNGTVVYRRPKKLKAYSPTDPKGPFS